MTHFAKIENNIVTIVLNADQAFIDSGAVGDPTLWKQTVYHTYGNVYYNQDGTPSPEPALRANYAGIGYLYDETADVFIPPKPYPSWLLNTSTWLWEPPVPFPTDGKSYVWDETTQSWQVVIY